MVTEIDPVQPMTHSRWLTMKVAILPGLQILTNVDTHYLLMLAFLLHRHPTPLLPLQKLKSILRGKQKNISQNSDR